MMNYVFIFWGHSLSLYIYIFTRHRRYGSHPCLGPSSEQVSAFPFAPASEILGKCMCHVCHAKQIMIYPRWTLVIKPFFIRRIPVAIEFDWTRSTIKTCIWLDAWVDDLQGWLNQPVWWGFEYINIFNHIKTLLHCVYLIHCDYIALQLHWTVFKPLFFDGDSGLNYLFGIYHFIQ